MKEALSVIKSNKSIVGGAALGAFAAPKALAYVEGVATPVVGQIAGKFTRPALALLLAGASAYIGQKVGKTQAGAAMAGVFCLHGVTSAVAALR